VYMRIRAPWPATLLVRVANMDLLQSSWSDTTPVLDSGRFAFDVQDPNATPVALLLRVDLPLSARNSLRVPVEIATRSNGVTSQALTVTLTQTRQRLGERIALPANDPDDDVLTDAEEAVAGTDPLLADTDGDRVFDGAELRYGIDPTNPRSSLSSFMNTIGVFNDDNNACPSGCPGVDHSDDDADGLQNFKDDEPNNPDRDGDGLSDGEESSRGYDRPISLDLDPGGCTASIGRRYSSMRKFDTDNDGLSDAEEIYQWASHPARVDTDLDWMTDREEVKYRTNPRKPNTYPPGVIAVPLGVRLPNC
jgi:hypothetical protein